MDIHYTHGRWFCRSRSSSESTVSFLDCLGSTSFTSAAGVQNTVSSSIQGYALGNCLSLQGGKKIPWICFISCPPARSCQPVTWLNIVVNVLWHQITIHLTLRTLTVGDSLTLFSGFILKYSPRISFGFKERDLCVKWDCVCVGASFSFICNSKLSGTAVPHWAEKLLSIYFSNAVESDSSCP